MEVDIHGEDYVPSAVPPAEVMAANNPKKPAKEGKLVCTQPSHPSQLKTGAPPATGMH